MLFFNQSFQLQEKYPGCLFFKQKLINEINIIKSIINHTLTELIKPLAGLNELKHTRRSMALILSQSILQTAIRWEISSVSGASFRNSSHWWSKSPTKLIFIHYLIHTVKFR